VGCENSYTPKDGKVLREWRAPHPDFICDVGDRERPMAKHLQDADPDRVAEGLEKLGLYLIRGSVHVPRLVLAGVVMTFDTFWPSKASEVIAGVGLIETLVGKWKIGHDRVGK